MQISARSLSKKTAIGCSTLISLKVWQTSRNALRSATLCLSTMSHTCTTLSWAI